MRTRPLCDLSVLLPTVQQKSGSDIPRTHFFEKFLDYFFVSHDPQQCMWAHFVKTAVLMANAIMDKDPVVEPKDAPPVPNNALYTARSVAISVRARRTSSTFPINAHGADEQQEFIMIWG